jgi:hypothetical protein
MVQRVIGAVCCATFALLGFSYGVHEVHGYYHGTPATATIRKCPGGKGGDCDGTWTIGGQSQTGVIERGFSKPPDGATVDVRVRDGTAYLAGRWWQAFAVGGFSLLLLIGVLLGGRNRGQGSE